jgi:hypothetical protein
MNFGEIGHQDKRIDSAAGSTPWLRSEASSFHAASLTLGSSELEEGNHLLGRPVYAVHDFE